MSARLLYVVDPMCSWCYGFAPVLDAVRGKLRADVSMDLVMGGLAPDSDAPMDAETRQYVQQAWRAVEAQTRVPFNHDFWTECAPRRSTYIACRAVILARAEAKEWDMLRAIQTAYYREARNPSDASTLVDLAAKLGMDAASFKAHLNAPETHRL
ncbi:MAG: DsbA family protein, partial [Planctomycetes bacterium]|nr:DsbA family protein [Planctomycetota bacterium]